jgi:hypothetical protein
VRGITMAESKPTHITVEHAWYGCDTGCCGHNVTLHFEDGSDWSEFQFDHKYDDGKSVEDYATELVGTSRFKADLAAGVPIRFDECYVKGVRNCW